MASNIPENIGSTIPDSAYTAYAVAAVACAFIALSICYGMSKIAASSFEAMARQPEAAKTIQASALLPCLLLEGIGVVAAIICMLVILLK